MAGAISLYAGTGIHLIRHQLHAAFGMTETPFGFTQTTHDLKCPFIS